MIRLKDLMNESVTQNVSKLEKIAKRELGNNVYVRHFKDNIYVVSPGGFYSNSRLNSMVSDMKSAIEKSMASDLDSVTLGTGGATEGMIVIRLK